MDDVLQIWLSREETCGITVRLLVVAFMAFTIIITGISGPSTKCSLYRKQSPATVRRMSRLGRYDPSPIMCRARRWMAVRRAKVVGAVLIHTSMPYSNTGRTKPRYTIAGALGLAQPMPYGGSRAAGLRVLQAVGYGCAMPAACRR